MICVRRLSFFAYLLPCEGLDKNRLGDGGGVADDDDELAFVPRDEVRHYTGLLLPSRMRSSGAAGYL